MSQKTLTGLDNLVASGFKDIKGKNIAILANHASVDSHLRHIVDIIFEAKVCNLVRIFGPEHGFRGEPQDMEEVGHFVDEKTKLEVYSLYGNTIESLSPQKEQLQDLDLVIFDLQDIGSRYYTYAQTLYYLMLKAKEVGVKVIVLDRPNPINGVDIEGSELQNDFRSFCGIAPVANRHGMTMGELALLMNEGFSYKNESLKSGFIEHIGCNLEVIKLSNWKRELFFEETGLPWVLPSPNMPTLETAIVYPGACLLEATNISEGRGTTRPFELFGATYINADKLLLSFSKRNYPLKGFILRPTYFRPKFQKFANHSCHGFQLHVTDRKQFKSYLAYLLIIKEIAELFSKDFSWRKEAYEFVDDKFAIDLLFGNSFYREFVEGKVTLTELMESMEFFEMEFRHERERCLLY